MKKNGSQKYYIIFVLLIVAAAGMYPIKLRAQEIILEDSNGFFIGPVIGVQDRLAGTLQVPKVLFRTLDGQYFMLYGLTDRLEGSSFLLYESSDCQGSPFLWDVRTVSPIAPAAVAKRANGDVLFVPDSEDAPQREISVMSVEYSDGTCQNYDKTEVLPAVQPKEIPMDLSFLTPPFRIGILSTN